MAASIRVTRPLRATSILACALALIVTGVGGASAKDLLDPVAREGGAKVSAREQERTLRYWTAARMHKARPLPLVQGDRRRPAMGSAESTAGQPGYAEGTEPTRRAKPRRSGRIRPADAYPYPYPYTRFALPNPLRRKFPYRAVGIIFGLMNGRLFSCTGASVASPKRHLVWTAGHCVSDGAGGWVDALVFVPAYKNGNRPYGVFAAKSILTTAGWHLEGNPGADYAVVSVGKNRNGKKLRKAVGALGFTWDQSRDLHWNVFGYPANGHFSGQRIQVCQASHATDDLAFGAPEPMGIGCDQQQGSSGGPWIYGLKRGNYINSNVSYGYPDTQPEASYGPYLTAAANELRCLAGTGGSSTTC